MSQHMLVILASDQMSVCNFFRWAGLSPRNPATDATLWRQQQPSTGERREDNRSPCSLLPRYGSRTYDGSAGTADAAAADDAAAALWAAATTQRSDARPSATD